MKSNLTPTEFKDWYNQHIASPYNTPPVKVLTQSRKVLINNKIKAGLTRELLVDMEKNIKTATIPPFRLRFDSFLTQDTWIQLAEGYFNVSNYICKYPEYKDTYLLFKVDLSDSENVLLASMLTLTELIEDVTDTILEFSEDFKCRIGDLIVEFIEVYNKYCNEDKLFWLKNGTGTIDKYTELCYNSPSGLIEAYRLYLNSFDSKAIKSRKWYEFNVKDRYFQTLTRNIFGEL